VGVFEAFFGATGLPGGGGGGLGAPDGSLGSVGGGREEEGAEPGFFVVPGVGAEGGKAAGMEGGGCEAAASPLFVWSCVSAVLNKTGAGSVGESVWVGGLKRGDRGEVVDACDAGGWGPVGIL